MSHKVQRWLCASLVSKPSSTQLNRELDISVNMRIILQNLVNKYLIHMQGTYIKLFIPRGNMEIEGRVLENWYWPLKFAFLKDEWN